MPAPKILIPKITIQRLWPKNINEKDRYLFKHEIKKDIPPVKLDIISPCIYSSSGIFKKNKFLLIHPFSFQGKTSITSYVKNEIKFNFFNHSAKSIPGVSLTITDNFSNGYFHWFSDALPRLFVIKEKQISFNNLILPAFAKKEAYIPESLLPFDVPKSIQIYEGEIAKLDTLIATTPIAPTGNYRTEIMKGLQKLYRNFYNLHNINGYKKIYISRAKAARRRVLNEDELLPILLKYGYESVIMEDLSFSEQVRVIGNANILISLHGAGLTNMLFMPQHSTIVEFRFPGDTNNNCYFSLANALEYDYYYLLGITKNNNADAHSDNLIIDPENLKQLLEHIQK